MVGLDDRIGDMLTNADFEWVAVPKEATRADMALNESVTCVSLNQMIQPCELSAQLLTKLREILRTHARQVQCRSSPAGLMYMNVSSKLMQELRESSAFKAFELQCCQLQLVDLTKIKLSEERIMFFCNLFNMITVHAVVVRGSPGTHMLGRVSFLKSNYYNVGGMRLSLLDIEFNILRHASTKLLDYALRPAPFAAKDPRHALVVTKPKPLITFCLFNAHQFSPPLAVLHNPKALDQEMTIYARQFLLDTTELDTVEPVIKFPKIVEFYWKEVSQGKSRRKQMLGHIRNDILGRRNSKLSADLGSLLADGTIPKVEFAELDQNPVLVL